MVLVDYNMKTVDGAKVVRFFKERFGAAVYCAVLSGEDDDTYPADLCPGRRRRDVPEADLAGRSEAPADRGDAAPRSA